MLTDPHKRITLLRVTGPVVCLGTRHCLAISEDSLNRIREKEALRESLESTQMDPVIG